MRSTLRTVAAAALLLGAAPDALSQCGPNGCRVAPPPSAGPTTHRSIARIVHQERGGASLGSGALIAVVEGVGYVLTCAHLFDGPGATEVRLDGQSAGAEVIAIDRRHDLALLRLDRVIGEPIDVASEPPSGVLSACGFGSSGQLRCVRGPITGQAVASGAQSPSLRLRGAVRSGDSGGPVFDSAGRLVAVVWGQRGGETFAMFGAPLRAILAKVPRPRGALRPVERSPRQGMPADGASVNSEDLESLSADMDRRFDELRRELSQRPAPLAEIPPTRPIAEGLRPLLTAVALGGPTGVALWVAKKWWRSRRSRAKSSRKPPQRPVAVDSPPPPQQVVPETHYVSYERDEFARAHQWACEQLARKFPGSVELLTSLDSLIRQQLNGS